MMSSTCTRIDDIMNNSQIRQLIREQIRDILLTESTTKKKIKELVGDEILVYGGDYWENTYFLIVECSTPEMVSNLRKIVEYVDEITSTGASRTFEVSVKDPSDEREQDVCEFDIDGDGADRVLSINEMKKNNPRSDHGKVEDNSKL